MMGHSVVDDSDSAVNAIS